jgi:hypothetical protein
MWESDCLMVLPDRETVVQRMDECYIIQQRGTLEEDSC